MITSVAAVLADTAARRPDHSALIHNSEHYTYGWLWEQACRHAAVLRGNGVRRGDRVVLLLVDTPQFPIVYFGVLIAGAVAVPLNAMSTASDVDAVLDDADARVFVCAASLIERAVGAMGRPDTTVLVVGAGPTGTLDLEEAAQKTAPVDHWEAREANDVAVVFYTSGTTGTAKGVMLTHGNILYNVDGMVTTPYAFTRDDVLLGCLPLSHGFGQICVMLTGFRAGITIIMMSRFSGREALVLMIEHRCTVFMGVPTMYFGLLDAVAQGQQVPRLDRAYSGGSALTGTTRDEIVRAFDCPVYEGYGMTETTCSVAYHHPEIPFKSGTVGVPINGITVGIADPNAGEIDLVSVDEVGEIVVRGPTVMKGYLGRPDITSEVVDDGWFRTGDLGRLDRDGYLAVVGRKKDLILRGGYNVYPREIEEVLIAHPAVQQVAVIGLPHPVLGEEIWAIIVPAAHQEDDSVSDERIIHWCKQRLAVYKCPRGVEFTDSLPIGAGGKVLKRALVSKYEATADW